MKLSVKMKSRILGWIGLTVICLIPIFLLVLLTNACSSYNEYTEKENERSYHELKRDFYMEETGVDIGEYEE